MDSQLSTKRNRASATEGDRLDARDAVHVCISAMSQERLQSSGHADLRNVLCEHDSGVTRLRGHLPSFYLKQLAHELVRNIHGIGQIENAIEVSESY